MKENEMTLLCVLLVTQIYNDVRKIVREELERVGLGEKTEWLVNATNLYQGTRGVTQHPAPDVVRW